jgi:hypothetical protein
MKHLITEEDWTKENLQSLELERLIKECQQYSRNAFDDNILTLLERVSKDCIDELSDGDDFGYVAFDRFDGWRGE